MPGAPVGFWRAIPFIFSELVGMGSNGQISKLRPEWLRAMSKVKVGK